MALETEINYYNSIKSELLKNYKGKYVLIIGAEQLGVFDRAEDAYAKGIELRGNVPMLIQSVEKDEKVEAIPCLALGLISAHI